MTIKSDTFPSLNSSMLTVCNAGKTWIQSNKAAITSGALAKIQQGYKSFTINLPVTFEPNNLRLNNFHQKAFFSGIMSELIAEEVMTYECTPVLNTSDNLSTTIDLNFNF